MDTTTSTVLDWFKQNIPELHKKAAESNLLEDPTDWDEYVNIYKSHQPKLQYEAVRPYSNQIKELMENHMPLGKGHFVIQTYIKDDGFSKRNMLRYGYIENGLIKSTSVHLR